MADTPKSFGQWHLVSETKLFVLVVCQCGQKRTIRKSTWIAQQHLSQQCKACSIRDTQPIHDWLFKKARVPCN